MSILGQPLTECPRHIAYHGIAASGRGKIIHEVGQVSLSCSGRGHIDSPTESAGVGGFEDADPPCKLIDVGNAKR